LCTQDTGWILNFNIPAQLVLVLCFVYKKKTIINFTEKIGTLAVIIKQNHWRINAVIISFMRVNKIISITFLYIDMS